MDILDPQFLLLFLIAVLVVTLRARSKKKGSQVVPGEKYIAIIGKKLETPLGAETPYACLLADGLKFGDGFQEKQEPDLPHADGCKCSFSSYVQRNYDIFSKDPPPEPFRETDLGELTATEARYYKYMLIAHHRDTPESDRISYLELAEQATVDPDLRERVRQHLDRS